MNTGPNYVYKCPNCGNLLRKGSIVSGNTMGSKIFSDGKRIAPMLPEFPDLTKCKKCDTIFWLSKLEEIGTFEFGDEENSHWLKADEAEFLEIEDYYNAIIKGTSENEGDELIIRQQIWWSYNDRIREGQEIFNDENDELRWIENVQKLKLLLDESDINHRIMIAEINRNLGDFETCISVIQSIGYNELNWLKEKFLNECYQKNKWVVELS